MKITDPNATIGFIQQRVDAGLDEQQRQIDALEQQLLKRAALVSIEQKGRKVRLLFTRRGAIHAIEFYADMSLDIAALRRDLLE